MQNRQTLGTSISGTKCDRDKLIFLQKEGDCDEQYNREPIRLKILKTGVITVQPPYMSKYGNTV